MAPSKARDGPADRSNQSPSYQESDVDDLESARPRKQRKGQGRKVKRPERSAIQPCTKYTLFFWNFFCLMIGLVATALGAYILYLKGKVVHDILDFVLDPACVLTLAGSFMTTLAFFGCFGALREITCFLKFYYICLCLLLLGEMALSVVMFVSYYVPDMQGKVFPKDLFHTAILHYRDDDDMQHLIDSMHEELGCCGLKDSDEGFLDWNDNVYFNCTADNQSPEACSVPYSCCRRRAGDAINYQCGYNMVKRLRDGEIVGNDENTHRIYTGGCLKSLGEWINQHALTVGGVMLGVLAPQVFVVILSRNLIEMILVQKSRW